MAVRVKVPENTPSEDTVHVMALPFLDWDWNEEQHIALKPEGDGVWSEMIPLEEGALVRYVYDRWDQQEWGEFKTTREALGEAIQIESRHVLVTPDLADIQDTIETWNDLRMPVPTGTIEGVVVDAATGVPLMDTNVSVGGIHTASDYDGGFRVEGVVAGHQRVTVHRNPGDYQPASASVELSDGGVAGVRIEMEATPSVTVTFNVALPEDTPEEAEVRLVGNIFQAGARPGVTPNMSIMGADLLLPTLQRVGDDRVVGAAGASLRDVRSVFLLDRLFKP